MRVRVGDHVVEVAEGATVLEAVRAAGSEVPALCHDDRLSARGSCRVCLVGVEGRGIVAACTAPAAEGMTVRPDDPRAAEAARGALELIVSELPRRALEVPADRSELVRACRDLGVTGTAFTGATHHRGTDHSHPYVKLDRDLCIACGRCVRMCSEVQGTFALELTGRGFDTVVTAGDGGPWISSPCVGCGGCVDTCPTGALAEPGFLDPRPAHRATATTCGYCGVGCTLEVHVRNGAVAAVTPGRDGPVNRGHACVKGRFAHSFTRARDRLTEPLLRREGRGSALEPVSWEEALAFIAERLAAIRERHGGEAIGVISSARATNEENYLAQKFARAVLGTNSVDNCSRLCHAPTAAGLNSAFGWAGGTAPFEEIDETDCVLVVGANPTEAHPVVGARIKQRVLAGARLVVVDPRRSELAALADVHLRCRAGTNVAVFNGLARALLDGGHADEGFLAARASGLDELRALLDGLTVDASARTAGVAEADLVEAARLYGSAERPVIVYGLGVTEHAHGTDGVRTLANLAILTGNVGVPGGGVIPLRGQNNVQGSSDMGALPDLLPGYQPVTDPRVRERFGRVWGRPVPERPGLRIPQMFDAALDGRLRALYVIGEDIALTDPDSDRVRAATEACELVVCHDLFPSRTAELADVVLPAASFLEKDGTFVNFDRRFQRVRPALDPPGRARSDFEILRALARTMGTDLGCATPARAMAECARLAPPFAGISHERLDRDGPLHWPCRGPEDPGEAVLHLDGFATPDGRAALAARPYLPPGERPDDRFPHVLITGRRLDHHNTGSMTRRTPNTELTGAETLDVNPVDAERLGVAPGDAVEVASARGAVVLPVRITDDVAPGEVFAAFHFPDAPVNRLTSSHTDEVTGCPEYKVTAVALRRIVPGTSGPQLGTNGPRPAPGER
ncbi:formate dehydrogenase subunit alpha [Nocardiopsis sp. EMB25]|uniref:formate dehydrogenase subunit alpha n=1 Tax=Nocardiopsis sp. EMB25 TaxID=2835867 RepID=UPI0022840920|nr:formate dehydrogenase subunit alpha [Nocardiopsis sp. EMB25]MCY9783441.1 formate dehydrogenase subunit alpha [Nocardiopsis sp. EMB25]